MCIRDSFEGPYQVKEFKGSATYVVAEVNNLESVRGILNVRQMKPYYHERFTMIMGNLKDKNILKFLDMKYVCN